MTVFRPCIDLHDGQVKQIVGATLTDAPPQKSSDNSLPESSSFAPLQTNFVSSHSASYYAELYRTHGLTGAHVIKLGPGNDHAAKEALAAWPHMLQLGGGINIDNAEYWLNQAYAGKIIVTSWLFPQAKFSEDRLRQLSEKVGREKIVVDISCKVKDGEWIVAMDKWQTLTDMRVTAESIRLLESYCSEFLVHAADVEGLCKGIDEKLVEKLGEWCSIPVTYAGGGHGLSSVFLLFSFGLVVEIVAALKKENSLWAQKILTKLESNSPTVMELNLETINLAGLLPSVKTALPPPPDLLASFKTDLAILENIEKSHDFKTALKLEKVSAATNTNDGLVLADVVLDPSLVSRDSWLASELDGATEDKSDSAFRELVAERIKSGDGVEAGWVPSLDEHIALTGKPKLRAAWFKNGKWLDEDSFGEEKKGSGGLWDGEKVSWENRSFRTYAHRTVTGLPQVRDVKKVVKGEACGSGDVAMTSDEVLGFFKANWNNFLDEERNLTSISASPLESWRTDRNNDAKEHEAETPNSFFPNKYYDIDNVADPNVSGVEGRESVVRIKK
ncbi:Enzyme that catalyzes the fourth step in the histidine pathway [Physocladia obscura]|uniref:1-(5-phosphoribosyl)-5-[(5-phosphoribosylamino)methylideneamino] imidazole-4-carboxamide isomerase n=1 Tax=Physocladia obscura TaxID=109957 RepID=A0AAD5T250_9FUNG|nr:Enzyme that catalyzes the fourth step in the histidine pathway [Physocladia obscura]